MIGKFYCNLHNLFYSILLAQFLSSWVQNYVTLTKLKNEYDSIVING
jgi:hypothetical protein